jgi:hypothetical protein
VNCGRRCLCLPPSEPVRFSFRSKYIARLSQDVRYGARTLRRRPTFTIAAGLSLALGIGIATAVFTVLNAVALQPLPYPNAGRLVWTTEVLHGSSTDEVTITADFLEWRSLNHSFTALAGFNHQVKTLTGVEMPLEVRTVRSSASLLSILGVAPAIGRDFLPEEDLAGYDAVAILAYDFWQRQFGGDRGVLGRPLTLDGRQFTVIGILPQGFVFPFSGGFDLLTPLGKDEARELERRVCGRGPLPKGATRVERMKWKLLTKAGASVYAARQGIVEPVFGQIKEARGFRGFSLRGFEKVKAEWALVCATHNLLKMYRVCWA